MPAKNVVQVSTYLKPEDKKQLDEDGIKEGRTLAAEIRLILERELERRRAAAS